jgi:uncharacterized RmlC-like cupin family protein
MRYATSLLMLLSVPAASSAPNQALADEPASQYISADQIEAAVAQPPTGTVAKQVGTSPNTAIWTIRRDTAGEVELHEIWNDVIIARSGSVTIRVGTKVVGNHQIKPHEWLGGKLVGGSVFTLKAGDVLFIPAGLPHQMTTVSGGSFSYLVIKTSAHTP